MFKIIFSALKKAGKAYKVLILNERSFENLPKILTFNVCFCFSKGGDAKLRFFALPPLWFSCFSAVEQNNWLSYHLGFGDEFCVQKHDISEMKKTYTWKSDHGLTKLRVSTFSYSSTFISASLLNFHLIPALIVKDFWSTITSMDSSAFSTGLMRLTNSSLPNSKILREWILWKIKIKVLTTYCVEI